MDVSGLVDSDLPVMSASIGLHNVIRRAEAVPCSDDSDDWSVSYWVEAEGL